MALKRESKNANKDQDDGVRNRAWILCIGLSSTYTFSVLAQGQSGLANRKPEKDIVPRRTETQ